MTKDTEHKIKLFVATFSDKAVWQVETHIKQLVEAAVKIETENLQEELARVNNVCDRMERELEYMEYKNDV
jgi:DNA-directed RNA polymerase alpha subunit